MHTIWSQLFNRSPSPTRSRNRKREIVYTTQGYLWTLDSEMLWVIVFLLKDSTLISIISKSKYSVFIQVKVISKMSLLALTVLSMGLLSWPSNHLCKKTSLNSKWINSQIKNNTTTKHLYTFIMDEQHLILIPLPLNALTLLTTGEIVGEWGNVDWSF